MTLELFNADCLEKMKDIADNTISLIICDLPYGILSNDRKGKRIGELTDPSNPNSNIVIVNKPCSWDIKIDLDAFWKQIKRIRKDDHTPCIHFCNTKFGNDLINSNPNEFRYDLVWCKSSAVGFLSANKKPMSAHEMIYVFSKKGANYNRIDIEGDFPNTNIGDRPSNKSNKVYKTFLNTPKPSNEGKRCMKSWFEISNKKEKGGHPTAKPIDLYKWLISRYSNPGDKILDPTFGSCNSGEVSIELGRNYIGIEMDKGFYDKAVERLITQ
jgi:site-specific DNA-methyltransferase (adenine-specific)